MVILRWRTRRACISILAALFVFQCFLIRKYLPFSSTATSTHISASNDIDQDQQHSPPSSQLSQKGQQAIEAGQRNLVSFATWTNDQWSQFKEHAVKKILYQDDDGDRTYDGSDEMEEIEQTDGSESPKALGAEMVMVEEMDDGEEDPTYFPGETKFLLDMPHWIPDWLTSKAVHPSSLWPRETDTTTSTDASNQVNSNIATKDDDDDDDDDDRTGQFQQQAAQEKEGHQKRPPILDIVYTWVNGSDPEWQFSKNIYESKEPTLLRINAVKVESRMVGRFRDNDELKHSLRSAYKFGKNVVRKIHISTADVAEEGLWKLWRSEEHQAEQEQQQEQGHGNKETNSVAEGEVTKLFKRSRKHFDSWMEFAKKHSVNRTAVVKGMEEGDKYIVADEEPPSRPLVLRQTAPGEETGQVPSWLDRSLVSREKVNVAHHSTFFKNKDSLPVFCSVAIESQLYRIPDLSEVFIYMNDDEYFGMELAQSDFWTPHYGLVLQINPGILVVPHPRDYSGIDPLNRGYIDNMQFTNYILSKRFGHRFRPTLDHIVQVGSRTIFKEIESLWPEAFLQTERSHFRTDYDGNTLSAMFLMAHYTIERLRETQLRSFWRYRVDNNSNGNLEWEERWALVSLVEDWNASGGGVNRDRTGQVIDHTPQFLSGFRQVLEQTGYGDTQEQPATRYVFSGMEGFPFMIPEVNTSNTIYKEDRLEAMSLQKLNIDFSVMPADRTCIFDLEFCLGPLFMDRRGSLEKRDGERVFKRLAFEEFHCGDCLLQIAMQSDRGVEYYLERIEDAEESGDWGEHVPFINRRPAVVSGTTDNNDGADGAENSEGTTDDSSGNADNSENSDKTNHTENADNMGTGDPQTISNKANTTVTTAAADTTDQPPSTDSNNKGNNNGEINLVTTRDDIPSYTFATKETIRQKILTTQSQTPYTTHTRGISAILPDTSRHSKARLRIIKDLYKYNFVIGESDSYFVTLVGLEKAQRDMAFLDKVKKHDKKLHIVCLNDGIIEAENGTEVRELLTHFLEDRYGDPAPWEKVVATVTS